MATTYLDNYNVSAYFTHSGSWLDITSDIVSEIRGTWGIHDTKPSDRLADTGTLQFTLKNYTGLYAPNSGSCVSVDWAIGCPIKLTITYNEITYIKFYGVIDVMNVNSNVVGYTTTDVTVVDWLNYAAKHPIINPALQQNQTADAAITTILGTMPINPKSSSLDVGVNTFPTTFDLNTTKTLAYNEFYKLVMSELGYLYLIKDKTYGEQLVFENLYHRSGLLPLDTIYNSVPILAEDGTNILTEAGVEILDEEGIYSNFVINQMEDLEIEYGKNVINRFAITSYPRKVDSGSTVLYSLPNYILIGAKTSITIKGNYTDPSGGHSINGINMITPVATTDYLMNSASNGGGTNLTGSLVVSANYGTGTVIYTLTNNSTTTGYITFLRARGYVRV